MGSRLIVICDVSIRWKRAPVIYGIQCSSLPSWKLVRVVLFFTIPSFTQWNCRRLIILELLFLINQSRLWNIGMDVWVAVPSHVGEASLHFCQRWLFWLWKGRRYDPTCRWCLRNVTNWFLDFPPNQKVAISIGDLDLSRGKKCRQNLSLSHLIFSETWLECFIRKILTQIKTSIFIHRKNHIFLNLLFDVF